MTPHFAEFRLSYAEAAHAERLLRDYIFAHTEHERCDVCNADLLLDQQHTPDCPVAMSEDIICRIAYAGEVK